MAYHQAPQHDLPEVVTAPEWNSRNYRAPGEYQTSYPQDNYTQAQSHSREEPYVETLYECLQPYSPPQPPCQQGPHHSKDPRKSLGPNFPRDAIAQPLPNYKPPPLRWFFLGAIVAVILGYVALVGYAIQTLPHESGKDVISDFADLERQLDASPSGLAFETALKPEATGKVRARQDETDPTPVAGDVPADPPADPPSVPDPGTGDTPDVPPSDPAPDPGPPDRPADRPGDTTTTAHNPSEHPTLDNTISVIVTPIDVPTVIDGKSTTLTSRSTKNLAPTAPPDPTFVTADIITLTDSHGNPTATTTSIPKPVSTPTVLTTTDARGKATTITTETLATPSTTVLTDSNGVPTATQTLYPTTPTPESKVLVFSLRKEDYFAGYFLPTILSVLLSIPIRAIDLAAQQYYPFHELTCASGAPARDSLLLRTGGLFGVRTTLRALRNGKLLLFLTSLLVLSSAVLIPLSSEAVSLKLYNVDGACTTTDLSGCVMALSVFGVPARATVALLAFMAALACGIMLVLRRWVSGVAANPWSAAGVASLCGDEKVRGLVASLPRGTAPLSHTRMVEGLEGPRFRLGYYFNGGRVDYGILTDGEPGVPAPAPGGDFSRERRRPGSRIPFLMLSVTGRALFAVFIVGLLVLILYYNNTGGDTPFERFMSQQTFGVRFLFTSVGVIISFFWASFFDGIAILAPYLLLSKCPQPSSAILLTPPSTPFSALPRSLSRRDPLLTTVSVTAILAEFLPILLNNVPFRVTQTWIAHLVCTWAAVGVLALMLLVVLGTLFVRWPVMPVDPSTLAGAMYYVADSRVVDCLEGVSLLGARERGRRVKGVGGAYEFGEVWGARGGRRVGIDMVDGIGPSG